MQAPYSSLEGWATIMAMSNSKTCCPVLGRRLVVECLKNVRTSIGAGPDNAKPRQNNFQRWRRAAKKECKTPVPLKRSWATVVNMGAGVCREAVSLEETKHDASCHALIKLQNPSKPSDSTDRFDTQIALIFDWSKSTHEPLVIGVENSSSEKKRKLYIYISICTRSIYTYSSEACKHIDTFADAKVYLKTNVWKYPK